MLPFGAAFNKENCELFPYMHSSYTLENTMNWLVPSLQYSTHHQRKKGGEGEGGRESYECVWITEGVCMMSYFLAPYILANFVVTLFY